MQPTLHNRASSCLSIMARGRALAITQEWSLGPARGPARPAGPSRRGPRGALAGGRNRSRRPRLGANGGPLRVRSVVLDPFPEVGLAGPTRPSASAGRSSWTSSPSGADSAPELPAAPRRLKGERLCRPGHPPKKCPPTGEHPWSRRRRMRVTRDMGRHRPIHKRSIAHNPRAHGSSIGR